MRDDELPDIRPLRPDSFVARSPLWSGPDLLAFEARGPADFDWIERMILTHGYYEHEGAWDLALGFDKQAMAEIMAASPSELPGGRAAPGDGALPGPGGRPGGRPRHPRLARPTVLEVAVDLPRIPKLVLDASEDARELGVGVQDVELRNEPGGGVPEPRPRSRWAGALNRLRALGRPHVGR